MGCLRTFIIVTALAAMPATAATAADMLQPLPAVPIAAPVIDEYMSGWYLRGDIGYRIGKTSGITATGGPLATNPRIDDTWFVGGGAGYKYRWFRADVTLDYGMRAGVHADTSIRPDDYYAKVENFAILANGYLDLGTWSGITPYVGAGIGTALVNVMEFSRASAPTGFPPQVQSRWNLAWAAMAGLSYSFSPHFLVDVGYRYLNMGDVATEVNPLGQSLNIQQLQAHEARLGFRYMFD